MKREKAKLYSELSSDRTSPEFLEYFFSYDPSEPAEKRNKILKALRKTRKNRAKLSSETKE
jgi:flavin-dependent dehydrogenase